MKPSATHPDAASVRGIAGPDRWLGAMLTAGFIGLCIVETLHQAEAMLPGWDWLLSAVVMAGFAAAVASLVPVLPWPNVLLAAGLVAFVAGMAHALSAVTGLPFGRLELVPGSGPALLGLIPWWLPVTWAAIAIAARGTTRLVLHGAQDHPCHGLRVILFAGLLSTLASIGVQEYAAFCAGQWRPESLAPIGNVGHLLHLPLQIAVTPLLLDKFPGPRPPNFRPVFVWTGLSGFLMCGLFWVGRPAFGAALALGLVGLWCAVAFRGRFSARFSTDSTRRT